MGAAILGGAANLAIKIFAKIPQVNNVLKFIIFFLAFVVEVFGNWAYIKVRYGGIVELDDVEIYFEDEICDDEEFEEIISNRENDGLPHYGKCGNVINLQDYLDRKKRKLK